MNVITTIQSSPALFMIIVAMVGLLVGSFLNVVIHRLPLMMERAWREGLEELQAEGVQSDLAVASGAELTAGSVATAGGPEQGRPETFNLAVPASSCPSCGGEIRAWQNIPILSWLLLRGKCAKCQAPISARYPIVEFVTMLLSLVVAWHFGPTWQALLGILVTWFLVAMTMIDFDHQLLPDSLTLPLMWVGLLAALFPVFTDLRSSVIGAAAGYLILWTIYQLFKLITGKEGMGYGDFKLLAALGALLGWQVLPTIILLSSLVGAVVGVSLIAFTGRDKSIPIPFGPYLAAAGWIAMLWGEQLTSWYYGLLA